MKIGIDLGGSHIGIGVIDKEGKVVEKQETDLNTAIISNIPQFIEEYVLKTIANIVDKYSIDFIGIASPGTPKEGKITTLVNLGIQELDITEMIKQYYDLPIQVRNDAKCAGIAEKTFGSLKKYQDAVFLCLGSGIGGSAFLSGKELKPMRNPGLEIGHMIINKDGRLCNCGKRGCFETYCSMKRLKNELMEEMNLDKTISSQELLKQLEKRKKEPIVAKILEEYIENLIVGLSNVIDIFEPQAICLGGGFVYFEKVLYEMLVENYYAKRYVFNKQTMPDLKLAALGNDAGMIGATIKE